MKQLRYFPIIYVRGFAATQGEMDQTTADPFNGFNLGSTVYRAVPDRNEPPRKYVFESPVVRLMSEFGYRDVYEDGADILDPEWEKTAMGVPTGNRLRPRSIIVHRYYDKCSTILGVGAKPSIEAFARELGDLILRARELLTTDPESGLTRENFRCYLVAHSMGGLVCRALLQNRGLDKKNAAQYVDKLFTYATPHNGIDMVGQNVPAWLSLFDADTFNRTKIAKLMGIDRLKGNTRKDEQRGDLIDDSCPLKHDRIFCMVGTNRLDYEAFAGLSRSFVGKGSDGLVRIANATLTYRGPDEDLECAKAFAYRSHSGFFGIVNSEEAFQNLARFLFGDLRVDIGLELDDIRLPAALQDMPTTNINALYQIEVNAAPRGKMWYLTRRTVEEDSVACLSHKDWVARKDRRLYLSSVFLSNRAKVIKSRDSLAYAMSLGIRVPDYEVDRKFWINEHYEGAYLFRNALVVEIFEATEPGGKASVKYSWQDSGVSGPQQDAVLMPQEDGSHLIRIPFESAQATKSSPEKPTTPGVKGHVVLRVRAWNTEYSDDPEVK